MAVGRLAVFGVQEAPSTATTAPTPRSINMPPGRQPRPSSLPRTPTRRAARRPSEAGCGQDHRRRHVIHDKGRDNGPLSPASLAKVPAMANATSAPPSTLATTVAATPSSDPISARITTSGTTSNASPAPTSMITLTCISTRCPRLLVGVLGERPGSAELQRTNSHKMATGPFRVSGRPFVILPGAWKCVVTHLRVITPWPLEQPKAHCPLTRFWRHDTPSF